MIGPNRLCSLKWTDFLTTTRLRGIKQPVKEDLHLSKQPTLPLVRMRQVPQVAGTGDNSSICLTFPHVSPFHSPLLNSKTKCMLHGMPYCSTEVGVIQQSGQRMYMKWKGRDPCLRQNILSIFPILTTMTFCSLIAPGHILYNSPKMSATIPCNISSRKLDMLIWGTTTPRIPQSVWLLPIQNICSQIFVSKRPNQCIDLTALQTFQHFWTPSECHSN